MRDQTNFLNLLYNISTLLLLIQIVNENIFKSEIDII